MKGKTEHISKTNDNDNTVATRHVMNSPARIA
jgi:hypothetical protein